jgi:formylglycine-generating enzyme required for sulfatase activity
MNPFYKFICALFFVVTALTLRAQDVSIPDTNLNAVVRATLQKPTGPLTESDMLGLITLSAGDKQISRVDGLEFARNLNVLDLDSNSITNFSIGSALTNLVILDVFGNHLTNFNLSNASTKFTIIDAAFNSMAQCFIPDGLTNLQTLFLEDNALTNFNLPDGLTALTQLDLSENNLASFTVRPEMTNLISLSIFANQLTNLGLPPNLSHLASVDADFNQLRNLGLPGGLTNLAFIVARNNQLTNLTIPADMTKLGYLDVDGNQLANLTLPAGLTNLVFFRAPNNKLTSFTVPAGLTNLASLFLQNNQLTNVSFSSDLKQLVQLDLRSNNLTSVTLPPDMTNLTTVGLDGNPLNTLVLSEPLAAKLSNVVSSLRNKGVNVFTYPLSVQLVRFQQLIGAFQFAITGPPGNYTILGSSDLSTWTPMGNVSNPLGAIVFTDTTAHALPHKFYRAISPMLSAPTNMVFIRPNSFVLGSPTNEVGHRTDESPQTTVTLSHGFWMSKFLVTQRDYLAVTGSNPSSFPGNLDRAVESVSWFDATNYCAMLTQQDLAAEHIPAGSHYRLPTEAEWECAARAGSTTRFYYGEDPAVTNLANVAWYSANSGFGTHPVGLKAPNTWGLYDMEGNVWEWCQDWYGPYPGGSLTDPQGAVSNPQGFKVIRGGAWESFETDCRSARRSIEGASPFITDFIIGFRVVLAFDP